MQTLTLQHPNATLRFHDFAGDGCPLLMVHGLGCAGSSDFPMVARAPALANRRCLVPDLLGHGFSDQPEDFDYSPAAQAEVLLQLVEALALPQIDLFGHSMGGSIAIELAQRMPTRVRRLVLAEPNLDNGGGTFSRMISAQSETHWLASGHAECMRQADDRLWAGSMQCASPLAVYRAAWGLVNGATPSWRAKLLTLPMPRHLLFGARSLPDADLTRLPPLGVMTAVVVDCGHSMANEQPAALAAAIAQALA